MVWTLSRSRKSRSLSFIAPLKHPEEDRMQQPAACFCFCSSHEGGSKVSKPNCFLTITRVTWRKQTRARSANPLSQNWCHCNQEVRSARTFSFILSTSDSAKSLRVRKLILTEIVYCKGWRQTYINLSWRMSNGAVWKGLNN